MSDTQHPLAPHELPGFLAAADGSDKLMVAVIIFLLILLLVVGNYYLKLHALPERMAHKTSHTQLQIITALALLALFTHNNLFWVAALLLAVVKFPDYLTPLKSIAKSLADMRKDSKSEAASEDESQETVAPVVQKPSETEEKGDA
jgi:hypothetical protein